MKNASALTIIADEGNLCGEAPVWDADNERLYWSDCVGSKFFRYDWKTRQHHLLKAGLEINGCALAWPNGFALTNNSGIWLWDGIHEPLLIADRVDGSKCQMNDCIADPRGRLIAGSCFYDPSTNYPLGKLICADNDGRTRVLDEGFHLANGLGFSPDNGTLYFTDSAARTIFAYDYSLDRGCVNRKRVFVKVPESSGLPDGLTVDFDGFVWSAEWYGARLVRYDPEGKVERVIETPAKQTSSVAFGGPDLTDIFITSAAKSEKMPIMPPGYDPDRGNFGGPLYRVNLGIKGKPEFRVRINAERERSVTT